MGSRREANREMTMPRFRENLRLMFPELENVAHQDTLNHLLSRIDVDKIEDALLELIQRLIRNKKFHRYLLFNSYYPIAIDGSQKMTRDWLWDEGCLERKIKSKESDDASDARLQYYVYVLESNLAFANGLTIPLMSEFLNYAEGDQQESKQDCELKAFQRLAK
jgi:hypothetical protein